MLLYLLRHGDAVDSGYDDGSRSLSPLGEVQAALVANAFVTLHLPLEIILSSPLLRAVQTAEIIRQTMKNVNCVTSDYLVPGTNERQLIQQLNELREPSGLLVGHEPHLRTLASLLVCGTRHAQFEFKKATMICIECAQAVEPEGGALKWMLSVDQMEMLQRRGLR